MGLHTSVRSLSTLLPLALIFSTLLTIGFQSTVPDMTLTITPIRPVTNAHGQNIWVMDLVSSSIPTTDWNRLALRQGWVKGSDATLPSGAAALTSDTTAVPLIYTVKDYWIDVVFAIGPDFGSVRLSSDGKSQDINLYSSTYGTLRQHVTRPLLNIASWNQSDITLLLLCIGALTCAIVAMLVNAESLRLPFLIISSALFLVSWTLYVPIYEGPDEVHHWEYARYLHDNLALPRIGPQLAEANSPPLYYALIAPLASDIATPPVKQTNTGNNFMIYEHELGEHSRYMPLLLARLLTACISLGTVLAAYFIGYETSGSTQIGLLTAGIVGFLPQFTFRGMNISNDSLVMLLAAIAVYGIVRLIKRGFQWRTAALTGVCVGLAYLAKINAVYLFVVFAFALYIPPAPLIVRLRRLAIVVVPMIVVLPWLLFNLLSYGDIFARGAMQAAVEQIVVHKSITSPYFYTIFPQLLSQSFVGVFGWMNIFMSSWLYIFYAFITIAACVGLIALLVDTRQPQLRAVLIVLGMAFCGIIAITIYINLSFDQPQGRYLFPALGAIAALWAIGLSRWYRTIAGLYAFTVITFAVINAFLLITLIHPIYTY